MKAIIKSNSPSKRKTAFLQKNNFEVKKAVTKKYLDTTAVSEGKPVAENANVALIHILIGIIIPLTAVILFTIFKKRR